jgi:succinate-semialdehyde dehydrogenase/glutarate-semialdehyde dehydrogenase
MKALTVGSGLDKNTNQGPLINEKAVLKVEQYIEKSVEQGAQVIFGGNRLAELGGTFFAPTVLVDVTNAMPVSQEETFGPVAPLLRYEKMTEHAMVLLGYTPVPSVSCSDSWFKVV